MSRYRGPRLKLIHRLGALPGLTQKLLRLRKQKKKTKKTQYRLRLEEKQKLRFHYGISERQLLQYVRTARRCKGSTGQNLLQTLEMRLDNIIYRAGVVPTIPAARQLVNHGHILVNKNVVDIPSYRCRPEDNLAWRTGPKDHVALQQVDPALGIKKIPPHIQVKGLNIAIQNIVERSAVGIKVNELLIVEFYSRKA